jgi:hypothetical protein
MKAGLCSAPKPDLVQCHGIAFVLGGLAPTRPAYGKSGRLPGRNKLFGAMLDKLNHNVKSSVDKLLFDWAKHGHLTLALDGNTNHSHIVKFLAMSNGQTSLWAELTRAPSLEQPQARQRWLCR